MITFTNHSNPTIRVTKQQTVKSQQQINAITHISTHPSVQLPIQ
jgi:hypothetical protein